jgi:hypothetical protein
MFVLLLIEAAAFRLRQPLAKRQINPAHVSLWELPEDIQ